MKHFYLLRTFLFALLAIFLLLIVELQYFDLHHKSVSSFLMLFTILIFISWMLNIHSFYKFSLLINSEKIAKETDRLQLEESQKLIQTLSSQRHDFKNQLQVIKMLAQLNKNEEIDKYIQDCNIVLDLSNNILSKIENPVIASMFLVFYTQAKEKGINFSVDSDLDFSNFSLSPVKITRILGNIIRNAVEILETVTSAGNTIQITIWEANDFYNFLIWNNGPVIPESIKEQIFSAGFSTKNSTGLGLSIVKQLVEEMNGTITVESDPELGTEFRLVIPQNSSSEKEERLKSLEVSIKEDSY